MSTEALAAPPAPPRSFRDAWLITAGHMLTHWYPATFYLLLPIIGKELGLSYSQIGLIMTCQALASAIANVPGGILVDTYGRMGVLMASSLFWIGVPYLLMGFTHTYWLLLACVMLVGFGNSIWHPTAISELARRFPERKGFVLSVHGMGGNVGDAAAPIVIGAMLTLFTWREVVVLNVVPGVAMALLILMMLGTLQSGARKPRPAHDQHAPLSIGTYLSETRQLLRNRSLLLLSCGSAFRTMTQSALLTFLPLYLAHEMGYSPLAVGWCLFALQVTGFIASPVAGHLSDKMGPRGIMNWTMGATAVILIAMAVVGRSPAFIVLIAVLGFFMYASRPVIQAWLMDATPRNVGGTSIGILFGFQAVGSAIGPLLGGLIADRFGLLATFTFLACTIIIGNLFILFMPKDMGRARTAAG